MNKLLVASLLLGSAACISTPAYSLNYLHVICDNEPDPELCKSIEKWYKESKTNNGGSCCGVADAYWADEIDRVSDKGVYITVTDDRDCKNNEQNPTEDDEDGNYTVVPRTDCIVGRKPRDGQHLFVPKDVVDHYIVKDAKGEHRQGNPTGHVIVYVGGNQSDYLGDGVLWPTIYCFMPGVGG